MENFHADDFEIEVTAENPVQISWIGECDFTDPASVIDPYISKFAETYSGQSVIVDFMKLTYMNSSTVGSIIFLCKEFDQKNIQTTIIYNNATNWQAVSFKALEALSRLLKNVSVEGKREEN